MVDFDIMNMFARHSNSNAIYLDIGELEVLEAKSIETKCANPTPTKPKTTNDLKPP